MAISSMLVHLALLSPLALQLVTMPGRTVAPVMRLGLTGIDVPQDYASEGWDCLKGGNPSGTFVRQANGVVVPTLLMEPPSVPATTDEPSAEMEPPPVPTAETEPSGPAGIERPPLGSRPPKLEEACSLGGGRVTGTFVRNANGFVVS